MYRWAISQILPVNDFKWVEESSQFNEDFIKIWNEGNDIGYSIEVDKQYPEKLHKLHNDLPFMVWIKEHWNNWKTSIKFRWQKRKCYSHKKFKKDIKTLISFEESA